MVNYKLNLINKIENKCLVVFHIGSNYSLSLVKIFIDHYKIVNYKIIFSGNNRLSFQNFYKYLGLEISRLITYNGKLNYLYLIFFKNKKKIEISLSEFIDSKKFIYITSYNYGLINYFIIKIFKIKEIILIEDGITNRINYKNKFQLIKNILYSIIFKQLVSLPNDWQKDKKIKLKIMSFEEKNETNKINLNKLLKDFIKNNKLKIGTIKKNSIRILILCAKNMHYDKGIKEFLNRIINYFNKKLNQNNNNKIIFYLKKHPSDKEKLENINLENLKIFEIGYIPIEFFDLSQFDYIISPPNTSIVNIKTNNLFDPTKLFYYHINQHEILQKIKIMNKFKIKKIEI